MKTIKFRGLRTYGKGWVYGYYFGGYDWADFIIENIGFEHRVRVVSESIGQFTGLHDKNGKEIYEGDVILQQTNNGKKPYEVKFEFGCFYAGFHNGSSTKVSPKLIQKNSEIIGNIFENADYYENN